MRIFPPPSKDLLIAFVYHSTRMERVPLNKTQIEETLRKENINPWVEGQLTCINIVTTLAPDEDFLPKETFPHTTILNLEWMKNLHKNLMKPVADFGEFTIDYSLIKNNQVGRWREERHFIKGLEGVQEMPSPITMDKLLHEWFEDLVEFHNSMREKIGNPHLFEEFDIQKLSDKAYETNLKLCCIKPFIDGSNRIARLTENLLRLNWGLSWKVISSEDEFKLPYIDDIKKMQEKYPN